MKAPGRAIGAVAKFSAGVQLREDNFERCDLAFFFFYRNAATVVGYLVGPVWMEEDLK